ncbi:MAG: acetate/propionate family kinase [Planctomycetota bacterium]|nr:acetate/propionate family kinase [Planctomycetota bacterium]MDA1178619.1 acetate/propionate family kinase [Planctomycetota bacterium]
MKVLVANLGSTSFKYRLFDMSVEQEMARGSVESIGKAESLCRVRIGDRSYERRASVPDHAVAVRQCLAQLTDPQNGCLGKPSDVSAIGFKAVHGGRISGVQRVTSDLLQAMEEFREVAPAHNPPYVAAMRLLAEQVPDIPLVAAFETDFHRTIPDRNRYYAIPREWAEKYHVVKWGFHGASHRYIARRLAEITGRDDLRIISCHLGGSSSLCAIRHGESRAASMGMSPQSGLPQNNRVGDLDPFALPLLMERTGMDLPELLSHLANHGGLQGLSGVSNDIRELHSATEQGNKQAQLALDVYVGEVRRYLGGMLVELGGADMIAFTGGIGENDPVIRQAICEGLESFGIVLDPSRNLDARNEAKIQADTSRTQLWVLPTNEELVVARQTKALLQG